MRVFDLVLSLNSKNLGSCKRNQIRDHVWSLTWIFLRISFLSKAGLKVACKQEFGAFEKILGFIPSFQLEEEEEKQEKLS